MSRLSSRYSCSFPPLQKSSLNWCIRESVVEGADDPRGGPPKLEGLNNNGAPAGVGVGGAGGAFQLSPGNAAILPDYRLDGAAAGLVSIGNPLGRMIGLNGVPRGNRNLSMNIMETSAI